MNYVYEMPEEMLKECEHKGVKPHAVGGGKCGLFSETLRLNRGMISAAAGC